jgi:hypothetical protein
MQHKLMLLAMELVVLNHTAANARIELDAAACADAQCAVSNSSSSSTMKTLVSELL